MRLSYHRGLVIAILSCTFQGHYMAVLLWLSVAPPGCSVRCSDPGCLSRAELFSVGLPALVTLVSTKKTVFVSRLPVRAVLSFAVKALLPWLSCHCYPTTAFLLLLSCYGCSVKAVLPRLPCHGCLLMAISFWLVSFCCSGERSPVMAVFSLLSSYCQVFMPMS